MELATTQSVLMQIDQTIQRFARMLASVLQSRLRSLMKTCVASPERARMGSFLVAS
ncbi:hypothetical protein ACLBOM_09490 [Escherichia coli]